MIDVEGAIVAPAQLPCVAESVSIEIARRAGDRPYIARIADPISVGVDLRRVRNRRAGVAGVGDCVGVTV